MKIISAEIASEKSLCARSLYAKALESYFELIQNKILEACEEGECSCSVKVDVEFLEPICDELYSAGYSVEIEKIDPNDKLVRGLNIDWDYV